MIAKFKQDLYNENFSLQDQGKCDENDTLQERIEIWFHVIEWGGPITDIVYDFDYNSPKLDHYFGGEKIYPEIREYKRVFRVK